MDDLSAMLNQVMSDPESMRQIQALASSLGLGGDGGSGAAGAQSSQPSPPPEPPQPPPAPANFGGTDLSALASLLAGINQPHPQPQNTIPDLSALSQLLSGMQTPAQAPSQSVAPDLSALAQLLSGMQAPAQAPAQNNGAPGLSALSGLLGGLGGGNQPADASGISTLTALLNGGNPSAQAPSGGVLPNMDVGTIMKLTQAFSSLQSNRANIDLLLALKPRLKEDRSKKVDDAIRVMQLIQFLPLIKESGLFGEMDKILGGLGGGNGGALSGLFGNVGNGLGGLLGGLGRR